MIDFKKLEMADIEVVSGPPNSELDKAFSAFLKDRRAKEVRGKHPGFAAPARKKANAKAKAN
jgi:hypothetical protein